MTACQRFSGVTKNAPGLLYQDDNNAVNLACCKSLELTSILAIALSDHFVQRKSFTDIAGVIAFFNGITSVLFAFGLSIHSLKNRLLGIL